MKQAVFFLLILFLAGCNSPQSPPKKNREVLIYDVLILSGKEKARTLVEKKIYNEKDLLISELHYENKEVKNQSDYEYNSKGQEVKAFEKWNGKLSYICKKSYDKRDSISKYTIYKPNKKLDFTNYVKYNKAGVNYKDLCINADGSVKFWDEYTYDHAGNHIEWVRYNPDSTVQSRVVYEYDAQNRAIKNTCSGELDGTYVFKYNKKGLKIEERAWNTSDQFFLWLEVYSYDKSNRITKIVKYNAPNHRPTNPSQTLVYEYK